MTLLEALQEVYDTTDQQNDLDPATVAGRARLVGALTRAAAIIATWRFPDGYRLHFRECGAEGLVELNPFTGIIQDHDGARVFTLEASMAGHDFRGWALQVGSYTGLVVAQAGQAITCSPAYSGAGSLTFENYVLSHAVWTFGTGTDELTLDPRPVEVTGLFDIEAQTDLELAHDVERFKGTRGSLGTPSSWAKFGRGVILDTAPEETVYLRVSYFHYPEMGTTDDADLCSLPEAFHEAVVQWVRYWAFDRGGDVLAAREALSKLTTDLRCLRTSEDIGSDFIEGLVETRAQR